MFGIYIKKSFHIKNENASSLQFEYLATGWTVDQETLVQFPAKPSTACEHSNGKGATDVCGRPVASVGVGLTC